MNRQTVLEIDTNSFKYNIEQIKKYVNGKYVIPVIKANAYGTYINKNIELIKDFKIVAVALVSEAITLRNIGYKNDILVINQPLEDDIENIIKYDITTGVCSLSFLKKLSTFNKEIKIHLEIETGMNRTGVMLDDVHNFINFIDNNPNIILEGVYTHFSSADSDNEYTLRQINIFNEALSIIKDKHDIKYIHSEASNGLINYNLDNCNAVRAGIIMYGYKASDDTFKHINLKPVAKLRSKISFIKEVDEGESISYSRSYITDKKTKIATIPIGYADGIRRELSNKGYCVINGYKAKIIGKVCMDSIMVDVTDIDCNINDNVYLFDNDLITLDFVADLCHTINYEILCTISSRVERVFI